jgi:hypothetical protein
MTLAFLETAKKYFSTYQAHLRGELPGDLSIRKFADLHGYGRTSILTLYKKWLEDPSLTEAQ